VIALALSWPDAAVIVSVIWAGALVWFVRTMVGPSDRDDDR
jgi:hypothetical protein